MAGELAVGVAAVSVGLAASGACSGPKLPEACRWEATANGDSVIVTRSRARCAFAVSHDYRPGVAVGIEISYLSRMTLLIDGSDDETRSAQESWIAGGVMGTLWCYGRIGFRRP